MAPRSSTSVQRRSTSSSSRTRGRCPRLRRDRCKASAERMRSPTAALLGDIGRQHRWLLLLAVALTAAGWVLALFESGDPAADDNPLPFLLALLSFLLLLAVFNNTEARGDKGLGRFPQRLFTLPISTLWLVALPMLAGIAVVEVFYLIWM